jgi:hypothetical protein
VLHSYIVIEISELSREEQAEYQVLDINKSYCN